MVKTVLIGSGNVASHLAGALDSVSNLAQIYSRNIAHASILAETLSNCQPIDNLNELVSDADFYIIAVHDDAIKNIVETSPNYNGIWAHTSGSVPVSVFEGFKQNFGVFYPLQTFNRNSKVNFREVPMFIEGNSNKTVDALISLAKKISDIVNSADSNARALFHRAAVFACNFSNYMWTIADDILKEGGYDLNILEPLLKITLNNALTYGPANCQTGPAKRGDKETIEKQLKTLPPYQADVYELITKKIIDRYNSNDE